MFRTIDQLGNPPRRFRRLAYPAVLSLLLATACTETNDLVIEVGTAVLVVADSDLEAQGPVDAGQRIQVAEWNLETALLTIEGDPDAIDRDLRFGQDCEFVDTALSATPLSVCGEGEPVTCKCSSGIILGVGDSMPVGAQIDLKFSMTVRRGVPVLPEDLLPDGNEDGDEFVNADDRCPHFHDIDDETDCSVDTDGDGQADGFDNCPWKANPQQEDTTGLSADGIPDGIGDACEEQIVAVKDSVTESETILVTLDAGEIPDLTAQIAFMVVDFQSRNSIACNWNLPVPECLLDTSAIVACVTSGAAECP